MRLVGKHTSNDNTDTHIAWVNRRLGRYIDKRPPSPSLIRTQGISVMHGCPARQKLELIEQTNKQKTGRKGT
jgi:hypothetical protein